jgi:hypothetical protein
MRARGEQECTQRDQLGVRRLCWRCRHCGLLRLGLRLVLGREPTALVVDARGRDGGTSASQAVNNGPRACDSQQAAYAMGETAARALPKNHSPRRMLRTQPSPGMECALVVSGSEEAELTSHHRYGRRRRHRHTPLRMQSIRLRKTPQLRRTFIRRSCPQRTSTSPRKRWGTAILRTSSDGIHISRSGFPDGIQVH